MSLINQVLQDLERRQNSDHRDEAVSRYLQIGVEPRGPGRSLFRIVWLLAFCVLLFSVFWWVLRDRGFSPKVQSPLGESVPISSGVTDSDQNVRQNRELQTSQFSLKLSPELQLIPAQGETQTFKSQGESSEKGMQIETSETSQASPKGAQTAKQSLELAVVKSAAVQLSTDKAKGIPSPVESDSGKDVKVSRGNLKGDWSENKVVNAVGPSVTREKKENLDPADANRSNDRIQAVTQPIVKEMSSQQRAEGAFKQATVYQQQGRNPEAILALQQALVLDQTHMPARQLLVSLLLDAKRYDDAVRELRTGLSQDLHQVNFAMLLARLLVERAKVNEAVEVLQKSAMYAQERSDYMAFLAALQQKLGHHREAIAYYRLALGRHSQNGVWWMGLGISLQAEGNSLDALEAFRQAKIQPGLGADLIAFVDQRIAQLQK